MPKRDMNDLLKRRMSATQQAAEIVVGDEAYETLFRGAPAPEASRFCDLPILFYGSSDTLSAICKILLCGR